MINLYKSISEKILEIVSAKEVDEKIKIKLKSQMLSVRKKLSEYKLNKTVNTAYANMNKNNLNIFSRKV